MADALDKARTERNRQIEQLHYNSAHDDEHTPEEIIGAGNAYIQWAHGQLAGYQTDVPPPDWPKGWEFKPSLDPSRNLTKGIALLAAGQDRHDREVNGG